MRLKRSGRATRRRPAAGGAGVRAGIALLAAGVWFGGFAMGAEAPARPSRGRDLDALMAHFHLYDVFPSEPLPGYPGADPAAGRPPWERYPEFQNYPGSVEHFRNENSKYIPSINPYNMRTLVRNFLAAELPGVAKEARESYAEPVVYVQRYAETVRTGQRRAPVPVVRLRPGGQRLKLSLDPLPRGLYVVRVVGCLEEKDVRADVPEDLILAMRINDGPDGAWNRYALRQRGTYNFYSMGEFFFRVETDSPRAFEVDLGSLPESKVDLLVHNVDVHDVLAELARRPGKTVPVAVNPAVMREQWASEEGRQIQQHAVMVRQGALAEYRRQHPDLDGDALERQWRRERDDAIWYSLPPINAQFLSHASGYYTVPTEADSATEAALLAQGLRFDKDSLNWNYGEGIRDAATWRFLLPKQHEAPRAWRMEFVDLRKPDGNPIQMYTWEDLRALKPLPGLPFEVPPYGRRFADTNGAHFFFPTAVANYSAINGGLYGLTYRNYLYNYQHGGHALEGRDLALRLVSVAYQLPTYSVLHKLNVVLGDPARNKGRRLAHEDRAVHYQFLEWEQLAATYDLLFDLIQNNQELADAVGRYVPWVKTPRDVVALLDTYLLQYGAREMMIFQRYYDHEHAAMLTEMAAIQADPAITELWMEAVFNWTWEYPLRVGPLRGFLYNSLQRDGSTSIGSFFYAQSGGVASKVQEWIDLADGRIGDRYSLRQIPRIAATPHWYLETRVAGMHPLGVGDVGGPIVAYGQWWESIQPWMRTGWRWTQNPRFAYGLVHFTGRKSETDAEWAAITNAATGVRNPFMANRSRILADWGGILEGGTQSDDFRFRHAARVRIGGGSGHDHADALDLGLWSLGLPVAPDGGARPGYGRPQVGLSWMHNVVTVDKADRRGHAWCPDLADLGRVQYLTARAAGGDLFARQVALIEVDQGRPAAEPPSRANLTPGTTYDRNVVLPRAYFVDFSRTAGGQRDHAYNFHGITEDEFAANVTPRALNTFETEWLDSQTLEKKNYIVPGEQWGGTVEADELTATWRVGRTPRPFNAAERGTREVAGPEPSVLREAYDPDSPRKYLRMHLPGQRGASFLTGAWISAPDGEGRQDGEWLRQTHVVRQTRSSLFAAVFEPYAGEPFIRSVVLEGDVNRAEAPAVLRVALVDGRRDLHAADLAGGTAQKLSDGTRVQARYVHVARDAHGVLLQFSLVGGRVLELPELTLTPACAAWSGTVTRIDYDKQLVLVDAAFPARVLDGAFFEVGHPASTGYSERWTNYEIERAQPQAKGGTLMRWRKGADIGMTVVERVARDASRSNAWTLAVADRPDLTTGDTRLAATTEKKNQHWRADFRDGCVLYDGPDAGAAFKAGDTILFHEFGLGATFRTPTTVALQRENDGTYRLTTAVPCTLALAAPQAEWSADGKSWQPVAAGAGGKPVLAVTLAQVSKGDVWLKW